MTKRMFIVGAIAAASAIVPGGIVSADHNVGPCNDSGGAGHSDYAQHHVVVAASNHVPGAHRGYSVCLGVH